MKATKSQDGELRFNVNVRVRIGRDDLINAMCFVVNEQYNTDLCNSPNKGLAIESVLRGMRSRKAFFEAVQTAVSRRGDSYWTWSEDLTAETANELREQVRVLVFKKFPELRQS